MIYLLLWDFSFLMKHLLQNSRWITTFKILWLKMSKLNSSILVKYLTLFILFQLKLLNTNLHLSPLLAWKRVNSVRIFLLKKSFQQSLNSQLNKWVELRLRQVIKNNLVWIILKSNCLHTLLHGSLILHNLLHFGKKWKVLKKKEHIS